MEIDKLLGRKVWLKSGGYIVIDMSEALVAIDVNTGRYVGKRNLADTILKTNLEAAKEIAYQLRLRNIGGIIIIDFIDMEREGDREKVYQALEDALKKDRQKTTIFKISELGLVEMTRKESEVIVEAIFDSIVRSLRTGDKIEIRGFGTFKVRKRKTRTARAISATVCFFCMLFKASGLTDSKPM
jgi:Rne/Rng family ribonuclease